MKLIYDSQKDRKELNALLQAWILARRGSIVSGMECRVFFNELYGIDIDHHEYAYVLDHLSNIKAITYHDHHGGDTQYLVEPEETVNQKAFRHLRERGQYE